MEKVKKCLCYECAFFEDCKRALKAIGIDKKEGTCTVVEALDKIGTAAMIQATTNLFKELGIFKGIRKIMFGGETKSEKQ